MNAQAMVLVFISFWSISAVGVYLAVVGLDNLDRHSVSNGARRALFPRLLLQAWDGAVLLMGGLLAVSGMLFLYMVVYG